MTLPSVFISYSHKDEIWKDRLKPHLKMLEREGLLTVWDDRDIDAGATWYDEIKKAMTDAEVAIFLISADYLTSDFLLKEEIPYLLERRKSDGIFLLPILIRPCLWTAIEWLKSIQIFPQDGMPLASKSEHEIEAELSRVAKVVSSAFWRDARNQSPVLVSENFVAGLSAEKTVFSQKDVAPHTDPNKKQDSLASGFIEPEIKPVIERLDVPPRGLGDRTGEKKDLLGFEDYSQALADFIRDQQTEKPLAIAIDAPWGMGKTTLMRMLKNKLSGEDANGTNTSKSTANVQATSQSHLATVWFDAWAYEKEESLWAALVLEILNQIRGQFTWRRRLRLWLELNSRPFLRGRLLQSFLKLTAYLIGIGFVFIIVLIIASLLFSNQFQISVQSLSDYLKFLAAAGLAGLIPVFYSIIKDLIKGIIEPFDLNLSEYILESNYKERIGFLSQFKKDYADVIGCIAKDPGNPLVVFIDDLDRCAPLHTAEIIESINLLLDAENCVFVIGMDARMVAASLEAKYKDLKNYIEDSYNPGELTLGQHFLEKIFQITFHIPQANPQNVNSFIDSNLGVSTEGDKHEPSRSAVLEVQQKIEEGHILRPLSEQEKVLVARAKQEIFVKSFNESRDVQLAIHEAKNYFGLNPRKIKRFINSFRLQTLIANRRGLLDSKLIQIGVLAKWSIISSRWPDVIRLMVNDPDLMKELKLVSDVQVGGKNNLEPENQQLSFLLSNQRIKRLAEVQDLMELLSNMTSTEVDSLPCYLHLAQLTQETSKKDTSIVDPTLS